MCTHACGLIHSILVTGPRNVTGAFASNSEEKAWWASSEAPVLSNTAPTPAIQGFNDIFPTSAPPGTEPTPGRGAVGA